MMKNYFFLLFLVSTMLGSCKVLTESQIKNINAFSTSAASYTNFPGEVLKKRAELITEEKLVGTILLTSSDQIKQSITDIRKTYKLQLQLSDTLDLSLQLIQQYAVLLTKLSSVHFVENLTKNTKDLNENLGDLVNIANTKFSNKIPKDVGDVITKAIFLVGERLTKNEQGKALKEFIPKGEILINTTVKNLVDAFSSDLSELLASDKAKFINTYTNTILSKESRVDYNSLSQYVKTLNDYDNLEQVRIKCIDAAKKLAIAHSKLNTDIQSKNNIREIFKETQDLIVSVQDLYKVYSQLSAQ